MLTFWFHLLLGLKMAAFEDIKTPWPESTNELYRPSDRRLLAKLVPTLADRGVSRSQRGGSHLIIKILRVNFLLYPSSATASVV
jgi:hypothetical protein